MKIHVFQKNLESLFTDLHDAADFFHVQPITIKRWLTGQSNINPIAEKLLFVAARGYLPPDLRWDGLRIDVERAVFKLSNGREFSPAELESFAHYKDEYYQLIEMHGHIIRPKIYPAKEQQMPFRGGRKPQAAMWIPSRDSQGGVYSWRYKMR